MEKPNFWFPAKNHGYGWGLPITWQGWVVFVTYFIVVIVTLYFRSSSESSALQTALIFVYTIILLIVCLIKGEKPGTHRD